MTKEEVLATEITSVPNMSRVVCRRITKKYWRQEWWVEGRDEPDDDRPISDEERKEAMQEHQVTIADIVQMYPWKVPTRSIADFVLEHNLTRVDWHALPYDEEAVMTQLGHMDRKDVKDLPLLVFGFFNRASRWIYHACGIAYVGKEMTEATIGQFLASKRDAVDLTDRSLPAFQHLLTCLRTLGFTEEVLDSGRAHLTRTVREKYLVTFKEAKKIVDVAIQEGWIPKTQLA